jgi:asparagine synthase (glutamine-hydrolysing)
MCGIAGVIDFSNRGSCDDLLRRMIGLLRHRGPDAAGIYVNGPANLAHTRLSIIDLKGGDQPIQNEDGTIRVVFNGEIFNYVELREELIRKGHRFYTSTDTEVLVHLYEDLGSDMLSVLNGQFAFALWDQRNETLFVARDRVGIRPLYYFKGKGRLVFGSEIKALMADPAVPRKVSPTALADIFSCWAPLGELTTFEEIYQIPAGCYAMFSRSGLQVKPYWRLPCGDGVFEDRPLEEWAEQLNMLLLDAARLRLRADVPVGAYLSGGLDSSYISALVKQKFNNRLCTFSVNFTDKKYDETSYQEIAVNALQTQHRRINCSETDIGRIFPQVVWHCETPIIRTAPAPLYLLSGLVRQSGFKVVLTGEGADELFAGYNIFKEDKVRRFWARDPSSAMRPLLLRRLYPYIFEKNDSRLVKFLQGFFEKNLDQVDSPVFSHLLRWRNTAHLQAFFADDFRDGNNHLDTLIERHTATLPAEFASWSPLSKAQYTEISIFLSNYLLASQGDRMAMAHGVEGRYPFLDHRVIEFAMRVPPRFRLNGLTEKYLLKQAARPLVPRELIARPKQPYRAPISRCFIGEGAPQYVEELLSEAALRKSGYFNAGRVQQLLHKCRRQEGQLLSERENMALVGILSTQLLDHYFIRNFPTAEAAGIETVRVF